MKTQIPSALIAVVSDLVAYAETHATLDSLFMYAEAAGEPPQGSKSAKAQEWLRATSKLSNDPLAVVGSIISRYLDDPEMDAGAKISEWQSGYEYKLQKRELVRKVEAVLARNGFQYLTGGHITKGGLAPSKQLSELIQGRDMPAIHREFDRALETVETKPREAVSAASNILESIFKIYIEDNGLTMPDKQDLQPVFKVVRTHLGLDPSSVADQDLQKIISGLFSIVDGIGSLRTHAGSAHSEGRKSYKLEPRHARLAVSSAHTVATFVIETWDKNIAANKASTRSATSTPSSQ